MKQRPDIDRVLQVWMADGPTAIPDRVVDVVAARIGVQRQRRAWPFRGRTPVTTPIKLIAALAAALVVAVVGYNLLPKQPGVGGSSPTPVPIATPPTATPTAEATPVAVPEALLTGGRYVFQPLESVPSFTIEATGPDGWRGLPSSAMDGPDPAGEAPAGIGIVFLQADGLFSDPCHWDLDGTGEFGQAGDVTVGPTVDDLVAALRANTFYTSSAATPVTIDGYAGQELDIQLPDDPLTTCDKPDWDPDGLAFLFSGSETHGFYAQGPANRLHLSIIDVEGTRLIAGIIFNEGTPQAELDTARNVIETLDINP
jgi:hypothetical protein